MDRNPIKQTKTISIVTPIYSEEKNIEAFYNSVLETTSLLKNYKFEFFFVDDGSIDSSAKVIEKLISKDASVRLLKFSRNFGKEAALTAGVIESKPFDAVITMDVDLQHPPKLIPELIYWWEQGYPVIATVRKSVGSHSTLRKMGSSLYYYLMKKIGGHHIIKKSTDYRLMDKKVTREFSMLNERISMFRGAVDWLGFKTHQLEFDAPDRFAGEARYDYSKLFSLAINSITSFSLLPLKVTGYLGIFISSLSSLLLFICIGINLYKSIWFISPIAMFVVFNTLLVGLLMICLGLIALYIGNISNEVVRRPQYVISEKLGRFYD